MSGDGTSNQGRPVTDARDAAIGAGAVINGLTIFNRRAAALGGYLAAHTKVRRGAGAGVISVDGWQITGPQNGWSCCRTASATGKGAAIMLKGMTTQYLIRQIHKVSKGDVILFHAAAGGVGLIACQWAKALAACRTGVRRLIVENGLAV